MFGSWYYIQCSGLSLGRVEPQLHGINKKMGPLKDAGLIITLGTTRSLVILYENYKPDVVYQDIKVSLLMNPNMNPLLAGHYKCEDMIKVANIAYIYNHMEVNHKAFMGELVQNATSFACYLVDKEDLFSLVLKNAVPP